MGLTAAGISGSVSIALDGGDIEVATFELPLNLTFDPETNTATLAAVSPDTVFAAAATALRVAAQRLLGSLPTAGPVTTDSENASVITCAACGAELAYEGAGSLEHADDGAHVFAPTYGDRS